jgi:hypothetical protein
LLNLVEEWVKAGIKVYSCYEAGVCGYWYHRELIKCGAVNYVMAAGPLENQRSKHQKTDRLDARALLNNLESYLRGNRDAMSTLQMEIRGWERFQNCRQIASYTGLCPRIHSFWEGHRRGYHDYIPLPLIVAASSSGPFHGQFRSQSLSKDADQPWFLPSRLAFFPTGGRGAGRNCIG